MQEREYSGRICKETEKRRKSFDTWRVIERFSQSRDEGNNKFALEIGQIKTKTCNSRFLFRKMRIKSL